ncbi:MAG: hypothetical protein Q8R98_17195, partial [Rubrivivax sp.]|nr:hypothetical protein [Rubrivivax sp.]
MCRDDAALRGSAKVKGFAESVDHAGTGQALGVSPIETVISGRGIAAAPGLAPRGTGGGFATINSTRQWVALARQPLPPQACAWPTDPPATPLMARPSKLTWREAGFSRVSWQSGHGASSTPS